MATAIQKIQAQTESNQPKQSTCLSCRIKFDTVELQRAHFKTEWHSYNLKRRVCNLEPIDLNSFTIIQAAAPAKQQNSSSKPASSQVSVVGDDGNESEWDDVDILHDEDLMDEDFSEEEAAEMLTRVIKSDTCLFCDKKSSNIEQNVSHMDLAHGFFIPEDRYLIDLEGMMEYLGFKVGAGATCLWCNKQFATKQGVRLHMMYKDHCKIMYDHEIAINEFKEFYDYSTQEKFEMKPVDQLMILKRRPERRSNSSVKVKSPLYRVGIDQLVARKNSMTHLCSGGSTQYRVIKKFNSVRAKTLLRTGMANNDNFRHRLRRQNPF